jgi:iron(III)-enterobactin esterase
MQLTNVSAIFVENTVIRSEFLGREVQVDFYLPKNIYDPSELNLLLINDGQNMILEDLFSANKLKPILCVAIHAGEQRRMEYGVATEADFMGRGAKAKQYTSFVMMELLLFIRQRFPQFYFRNKTFAGFSLGGLMALDIVWNYPEHFRIAGVFSGSLWWRNLDDQHEDYADDVNRIMHQQIKNGRMNEGQKFFFTTGSLDETNDRNNNGVIDSIDDTISLINDLESLGYKNGKDIRYINYEDGKHDLATWSRAMPEFLNWAFAG